MKRTEQEATLIEDPEVRRLIAETCAAAGYRVGPNLPHARVMEDILRLDVDAFAEALRRWRKHRTAWAGRQPTTNEDARARRTVEALRRCRDALAQKLAESGERPPKTQASA